MRQMLTLIRGEDMQKCINHIRERNPFDFAVFKHVTSMVLLAGGNDVYIIGSVSESEWLM